jgi:hypothetical protein
MSGKNSEVIDVQRGIGLFKSRGYAWKHNKDEIDYLRKLYAENIKP